MDSHDPSSFECAACGAEFPANAIQYDDLGYPECPECGARTGPLASLDSAEAASGIAE